MFGCVPRTRSCACSLFALAMVVLAGAHVSPAAAGVSFAVPSVAAGDSPSSVFARGDFDAAFAAHDPSTEWRTAADEPDRQTYRGIGGLRRFVGSLTDTWDGRFAQVMEFEAFIDCGEWVVVPWSAQLRGKGSGISVPVSETYAVRVRGGKIVCVDEYRSREQALEAIGLRD